MAHRPYSGIMSVVNSFWEVRRMLKLEHFQYIAQIAKSGSISAAAEALYLSQPYLSKEIREIERELGVKLFERGSRGVRPTEAGHRLIRYGREINSLVERAESVANEVAGQDNRLLVSSIYSFTMLDLFCSFVENNGLDSLRIFYEETPNALIPTRVSQRHSDVGIMYLLSTDEGRALEDIKERGLAFSPLCREGLCAVFGSNHPLASFESVTLSQLRGYPMLIEKLKLQKKGVGLDNSLFPELFYSQPRMPMVFDNSRSLMYYLTRSNRCFAIGQKALNLTNPFVTQGQLRYVPIDVDVKLTTGYVVRLGAEPSGVAKGFIESLCEFFSGYDG